jgi:hypothetical protein
MNSLPSRLYLYFYGISCNVYIDFVIYFAYIKLPVVLKGLNVETFVS